MAYFDHSFTETRPSMLTRVARLFETPHDRKVRARAARIEALRSRSDAELAAMGLTRDTIVMHVFNDKLLTD